MLVRTLASSTRPPPPCSQLLASLSDLVSQRLRSHGSQWLSKCSDLHECSHTAPPLQYLLDHQGYPLPSRQHSMTPGSRAGAVSQGGACASKALRVPHTPAGSHASTHGLPSGQHCPSCQGKVNSARAAEGLQICHGLAHMSMHAVSDLQTSAAGTWMNKHRQALPVRESALLGILWPPHKRILYSAMYTARPYRPVAFAVHMILAALAHVSKEVH